MLRRIVILLVMLSVSSVWYANGSQAKQKILLPIKVNSKWGYIDEGGKVIILLRFSSADRFSENFAAVSYKEGNRKTLSKGYINTQGKVVIKCPYNKTGVFSEGLAPVYAGGFPEKWGYINKAGKLVIKPQFSDINDFKDGIAIVGSHGKSPENEVWYEGLGWGFIDRTGKYLVKPRYSEAGEFIDGLVPVQFGIYGQWGYVDRNGEQAIPTKFAEAGSFGDGLAPAGISSGDFISHMYTNKEGKLVEEKQWDPNAGDRNYGYIDKTGRMIIKPRFTYAGQFSEGLAFVNDVKGGGFIDTKGRIVFRVKANSANPFLNGVSIIFDGSEFHIINIRGSQLVAQKFKKAVPFDYGYTQVWIDNNSFGYIDKTGKWIWKPTK